MSVPNFTQASQGLAAMQQQQHGLNAAVTAGDLWMEPDVAERATARCEQQIEEVESILDGLRDLGQARKFGDNADGRAAAMAFRDAAVTGGNSVRGVAGQVAGGATEHGGDLSCRRRSGSPG